MPQTGASCVIATRRAEIRQADCSRVITRLFLPGGEDRIRRIIDRVLTITEDEVSSLLDQVMEEFAHRHRRFIETLQKNFQAVAHLVPEEVVLTDNQKLLIGAYFTSEYSIQAAGVLNPSIALHPNQANLREGQSRYFMTFRCVGEGHISSLEFRSCVIDDNYRILTKPISCHVETPELLPNGPALDRGLFEAKLRSRGLYSKSLNLLLQRLPDPFTIAELNEQLESLNGGRTLPKRFKSELGVTLDWMQKNVYSVRFRPDTRVSGRVLFPVIDSESRGIEDARLVRFTEEDGEVTYYATYTGYNGFAIVSRILETTDFTTFKSYPLVGKGAQNKGLALFPRRINGKYALLSRLDNESNYVAYSDNLYCWDDASLIRGPASPWEFVQIGNGGPPVETEFGWVVLTHGVGAMRKYCIGVDLLDLDDPTRLIGRTREPILTPNEYEREGYVPNVVYSCGAVAHRDALIITYAMSDWESGIATVPLKDLLSKCLL
jgi:predicted GH43/DUF377 family glycosyl hydrolase